MQEMVADLGNSCKIDNIPCVSGTFDKNLLKCDKRGVVSTMENEGGVKNPQKSTTICTVFFFFL